MAGITKLGMLLETSKTTDILLYVRDHPYCKKTDIYKNVSRSIHIPAKIEEMQKLGLITLEGMIGSNATHLSLTNRGVLFTDLLLEAESLLNDPE